MHKTLVIASILFCCSFASHVQKKKVIFFGDSITQAGVGPTGYISVLQEKMKQKGVAENYELIGAGIGGNKVYDLYLRLDEDVLKKDPDIVVVWVGVNDVWHKASSGTGTDADKFENFYTALIAKLKAADIKVYMCTPAVIGERTDFSNQMDGDLNRYSDIIRDLAAKHNCELIDLRKAFLEFNMENNKQNEEKGILTTDRVHLNDKGNGLVAEQMMKALVR